MDVGLLEDSVETINSQLTSYFLFFSVSDEDVVKGFSIMLEELKLAPSASTLSSNHSFVLYTWALTL